MYEQITGHNLHVCANIDENRYESVHENTNYLGFRPGTTQTSCTVTEDGYRLEILDLESRGIVLSVLRKQRH